MAQAAHNASLNLQVGSRVQVYWPDDDAWCAAALRLCACGAAGFGAGRTRASCSCVGRARLVRYTGTVSALNVERRVGVVDYDDGAPLAAGASSWRENTLAVLFRFPRRLLRLRCASRSPHAPSPRAWCSL
jgi:hypothetical protein